MDDVLLQSKRDNAIVILEQLIAFLDAHDLGGWSPRLREIIDALHCNKDRAAIAIEKAIPRANMGSFGDFYINGIDDESDGDAEQRFLKLNGAAGKSIANIRLYLDYEMNRPLIDT